MSIRKQARLERGAYARLKQTVTKDRMQVQMGKSDASTSKAVRAAKRFLQARNATDPMDEDADAMEYDGGGEEEIDKKGKSKKVN